MFFPACVANGSCFLSWGSGGGGLFAPRSAFFPLIASSCAVYGKSEKRWCFTTCESTFRVAGVGLCGPQAKVASQLSNRVVPLSMIVYEESETRWCFVTCESTFCVAGVGLGVAGVGLRDFVALKRKLLRSALMASPHTVYVDSEKRWCVVCEVCSVECEVCSVKCGVWSEVSCGV